MSLLNDYKIKNILKNMKTTLHKSNKMKTVSWSNKI